MQHNSSLYKQTTGQNQPKLFKMFIIDCPMKFTSKWIKINLWRISHANGNIKTSSVETLVAKEPLHYTTYSKNICTYLFCTKYQYQCITWAHTLILSLIKLCLLESNSRILISCSWACKFSLVNICCEFLHITKC